MSNNQYIVIIYAGKTNKGANSIIANYIAAGIKKSSMNVVGPIDINFQDSQKKENLINLITNSSGLIIGSGVYNGNIEPTLTEFFDNFAGAGFKSSFLSSKVAGQFATAGDCGTGGQLVLNSLSRLMQTFGANIINGGSWHTAQGILGIVTKDKTTQISSFKNKYIEEDANSYGERIGRIAKFFEYNYNKSMSLPEPQTGKTCEICQPCQNNKKHKKQKKDHNNNNFNQTLIILTIILIIFILMIIIYLNYN
jgi:multimeric flavodoxin WrbA